MKLFACLVLVVSSVYTKGQSRAIDDLKNVESMPYICRGEIGDEGCGDTLFWKVVKMKLDVVPALIEKLDDTSSKSKGSGGMTTKNIGGKRAGTGGYFK